MALKRFRIIFLPVCLLLVATNCLPDTIKLKNGSVIKGKVITYGDREFTVLLDLGSTTRRTSSRMVIAVDDVDTIQFDIEPPATPPVMQEGVSRPARTCSVDTRAQGCGDLS